MKTTYSLGTRDGLYCLSCGTLGDCIKRFFYDLKHYVYRDITEYTIFKVKHPDNLRLDWGLGGDCYFLDENDEIAKNDDELLGKLKIVRLKESDLEFIKKYTK